MDNFSEVEESFWGVCLEPGKKYSQIVDKSIHVSMAAIDPSAKGSKEHTSLWFESGSSNYLLCSLGHHTYQQHLDLNFNEAEAVTLYSKGTATIHLTGYLHLDTDFAPDDDDDYKMGEDEGDDDDDDFIEDEADVDEEEVDEPKLTAVKKRKLVQKAIQKKKKTKVDSDESEDDDDEEDEEDDDIQESKSPLKKSPKKSEQESALEGEKKKKKKKKKKNKGGEKKEEEEAETPSKLTPAKGSLKKKVVEGGVVVENLKEGHGPEATPGKNVKVYYTGKLQSGKIFDANTSGTPFSFKLGRKEVIAGWDVGLAGMKVGGKRKLTIPAKMGYGAQKVSSIPPNSTLIFDVELKAVKN